MTGLISFAIGMPGTGELVVILAIVLVLFGGAKIPDIAKNLGKGIREFKKALTPGSGPDDEGQKPDSAKKP